MPCAEGRGGRASPQHYGHIEVPGEEHPLLPDTRCEQTATHSRASCVNVSWVLIDSSAFSRRVGFGHNVESFPARCRGAPTRLFSDSLKRKSLPTRCAESPPFIDPSVDRVLGYPEVGCHLEDSDPTFLISHLNPLISCENKDLCPPIKPDISIRNLSIPINVKLLAGHEMKLLHTWPQTATGCRGFSGLVLSRLRSSNPPPQRARLTARRPISLTQASDRLAASKNPGPARSGSARR